MLSPILIGIATNAVTAVTATIAGHILAKRGEKTLAERTVDQALRASEHALRTATSEKREAREDNALLRGDIDRLHNELGQLRTEMQEMRHEHAADLAKAAEAHRGCEQTVAELRRQIEDLLKRPDTQPEPDYRPADLKRVGGK